MKASQANITFYPADKVKNLQDINYNFEKGHSYSVYQAKLPGIGTNHLIAQTVSKGDHEGLNIDNLMAKIDKISHHHLFALEYYSYELNLDDRLRRNWDIWLLYEPYKSTLEELVSKKRETNTRMTEDALANFMKDMISLFAYFQHFGIKHKPIHPRNFLVVKDDSIKFDGIDLGPYNALHPEATETPRDFKAPEEIIGGHIHLEKVHVFQLGLIFLYAASTRDVEKLNDNVRLLKERIAELNLHFSKFISETLKIMLSFNDKERPGFEELYKQMKKNEQTYKIGQTRSPGLKTAKTISFAENVREEKKSEVSQRQRKISHPSPTKDFKGEGGILRAGSHDDVRVQSFGKASAQQKSKGIESETLKTKAPLEIWYEKEKPKVKVLHTFLAGTRSLMIVPLISIKTLFVEIVELDIPFVIPTSHSSVCSENGRIYLMGGREEEEQDSNCYYYMDGEETLVEQESFLEPMRLNAGAINVGNKIYLMGGSTTGNKATLSSCEVFNTEENIWQEITSMKNKCMSAMYCTYNDEYIYRYGGIDENGRAMKIIEKYLIKMDKWVELSAVEGLHGLTYAKNAFGRQINEAEIFIFGGSNEEDRPVNQTYVIDCRHARLDGEKIKYAEVHCPKTFSMDETHQNQAMVTQKELVFLAISPSVTRICGFNSETWRELKKINSYEM